MTKFTEILQKLHRGINPYTSFPKDQWLGRWYDDPGATRDTLKRALDIAEPGIVVEVGSFVGESACFMANHRKMQGRETAIICVDTWCFGIDHYKGAPEKITNHFGRPDLYYRFIANVMERGHHDMILPLAMDSVNGARLLKFLNIVPTFVYVDASHEGGDVLRDYEAYWDLLPSGGVMVVDDLTNWFPGVLEDWAKFLDCHRDEFVTVKTEGEKGVLIKR